MNDRREASEPARPEHDQETWQRIDEVFRQALEQSADEREAWVVERCGSDEALCQAVLDLLADDRPSAELLDRALEQRDAVAAAVLDDDDDEGVDLVGKRIGPYRLESVLGVGGMGVVYRAQREDGGFRQTVAVKILPGWATDAQTIARLRTERQILSSLQHPGIAPLLDGGRTGDGFPYLVTVFINGNPIHHYTRERELDVEAVIDLFLEVADAVEYAHGEGVIHRDLKPANILVDGSGRPRLLDFGIAKLREGVLPDLTMPRTATGFTPMTPEYASPEQHAGAPVDVTSDVYQLGLLLYELLTGERPRGAAGSQGSRLSRPSTAMDDAARRGDRGAREALRKRAARLRGDLDTIVLKALRESPEERYASAGELAADLRRFRAGEPIIARPDSVLAGLHRRIGTQPLAWGLGLVPVLVLVVLAGWLAWQRGAPDRPGGGPTVTPAQTSEAADTGAGVHAAPTGDLARLEAFRLQERGRALLDQRSPEGMAGALLHFERALEADPEFAPAWAGLADALLMQVAYGAAEGAEAVPRAETAVQQALALDPDLAEAWTAQGTLHYLDRDAPAALAAYQEAIERDPGYASAHTLAAYTYGLLGEFEAALSLAREGARLDPLSAEALINVYGAALATGRTAEALEAAQRARELSPGWLTARFSEAQALLGDGHYEAALALLDGIEEPWLGGGVGLLQARAELALGREDAARARQAAIEASGDTYALAAYHAAIGERNRAFSLLREISQWGDLPTLLLLGPDRTLWDPEGNDARYDLARARVLASWGVDDAAN